MINLTTEIVSVNEIDQEAPYYISDGSESSLFKFIQCFHPFYFVFIIQ